MIRRLQSPLAAALLGAAFCAGVALPAAAQAPAPPMASKPASPEPAPKPAAKPDAAALRAKKAEAAKLAAKEAAQSAAEAIKLVRALYDSPMAAQSAPMSARLQKLRDAAIANSKKLDAPVAGLDFAFELNAQDSEPGYKKSLRIAQLRNDGKRARVRATFRNYRPVELWFELVRQNDAWTIDDVQSRRDPRWSLANLYAMGAKEK